MLTAALAIVTTGVVPAAHATVTDSSGGGYQWSDCIYHSPKLAGSTRVSTFNVTSGKAKGTWPLDCQAVRHIKADHGYDDYTDNFIMHILGKAGSKSTSKTEPDNDLIGAAMIGIPYYFRGFVAAEKGGNHRIVTAYTRTNMTGMEDNDGAWRACSRINFQVP